MKVQRNRIIQFRVSDSEEKLILNFGKNKDVSSFRDWVVAESNKCFGDTNEIALLNREIMDLDSKIAFYKSEIDKFKVKRKLAVAMIEKNIEGGDK